MAPQSKMKRPEVDAAMTICSRTLTGEQSLAVQVATHHQYQLTRPKSGELLKDWIPELELDILTGFNVDPSRYQVHIHDLTPAGQPCPEGDALATFKVINVNSVVSGPFEVHFVLREGVRPFTIEDLMKWQVRYAGIAAEPLPALFQNIVTICESRDHIANVFVDRLALPPKGDVTLSLRHGLGLPTEDLTKLNLGRALKIDLKDKEVTFHLNGEDCDTMRDVSQLATTALTPANVVKLHLPSDPAFTYNAFSEGEEGGEEESDEDEDEE
jgi:hypothetical protein